MRLAPVRMVIAAVQMVLLLSMQLAEGTGVHHCPEHDAGAGAGTPQMAMHHGHHSAPSGDREHRGCHCMGVCCQATLAPSAPRPLAIRIALAPASLPEWAPATSLRRTVRLLPFAIGPPSLA